MNKISVIIITYNEEQNIGRCLKSLNGLADEIIVVDSKSTDKTKSICDEFGVTFIDHPFAGYGQQKNFATGLCKNEWIFSIDADEELTPELVLEIENAVNSDESHLYLVNRKTFFRDQWIKHGGWFPDWIPRLYHKEHVQWSEPEVHEYLIATNGKQGKRLMAPMLHHSFPTLQTQLDTNVKYAKKGALALSKKIGKPTLLKVLIKPFGKFIECYFIKLGFLDGVAGLIIALNASYSMFMKYSLAYFGEE